MAPRLTGLAVALLVGLVAACGSAPATSRGPIQTRPARPVHLPGRPAAHIAVIVMENSEYGDIIGSRSAPYINSLASRYALATNSFAIAHPSLPNYLALTGGSRFGIGSDCTDCAVSAPGLADQLDAAHISWRAYMENLPYPCFPGAEAGGGYAKKHDPFVYYDAISRHPARCARIVSLAQLAPDERTGSLPKFAWITPNLCHDMHDCDTATGDRFLSGLVPALLRALGSNGLLILTWDEGSSDAGCCRLASGGHIPTIIAGPEARPGTRSSTPIDHYSVLQSVEDVLGVRRLGGAGCVCTPSLGSLLRR